MHWATKNKNNYRPNHRAQNEAYNHKQNYYFKDICDGVPSFINIFDFDQFKFIFSSNDVDICSGGFRAGVRRAPPLKFAKHMLYNVN